MNGNGTLAASQQTSKKTNRSGPHRRNAGSSDEDEDDSPLTASPSTPLDPLRPWLRDFKVFIDTRESELPEGMGMIQWWGVSNKHYLYDYRSDISPAKCSQVSSLGISRPSRLVTSLSPETI